jgi:hypothetical protein
MSTADFATLSLLDPDQGVCPNGHRCRLSKTVGRRACTTCGFHGIALICWEITADHIERAERAGADALVVESGRLFVIDRDS